MKTHFPPRKIIAAVDNTPPSWSALSAARSLAKFLDCSLEAAYVEPFLPVSEFQPVMESALSLQKDVRAAIKERLADVPLRLLKGPPIPALAQLAAPRTAELMVMGTHGRVGADRILFGSVAEGVLHRARIPVLTIREGQGFDPRRILVPCNLEPYGAAALRYAVALGARLGAEVAALYVAAPGHWEVDSDEQLRRHLQTVLGLDAARRVLRVVRFGDAREQIATEAHTGLYGLLALSAHHRKQLSDLALGTTAERLLRQGGLPLLAIPAPTPAPKTQALKNLVWK